MIPVIAGMAALAAYNAYQSWRKGKEAARQAGREERTREGQLAQFDKLGDLSLPEFTSILQKNPKGYEGLLKELKYEGFDPAQAEFQSIGPVEKQGRSELGGVKLNAPMREAQYKALAELQGISDRGGASLAEEANINRLMSQSNTANRGRQEAIANSMASRGLRGSGMDAMLRMQAAQSDQNAMSLASQQQAAASQERALQALLASGQMAAGIENTDYGRDSAAAQANDAINNFNTKLGFQAQSQDADARNRMNVSNANLRQDALSQNARGKFSAGQYNTGAYNSAVADRNNQQFQVDKANTATQNADLLRNKYSNILDMRNDAVNRARDKAQVMGGQANMFGAREQRNATQSAAHADAAAKGLTQLASQWGGGGGGQSLPTNNLNTATLPDGDPRKLRDDELPGGF